MAITPFHGMDRSFDRMFEHWPELSFGWTSGGELVEREDEYVYVLDLPGFDRSDIDLRFDAGTLSIVAERSSDAEYASRRSSVREHVHVPGTVDEDAIAATFKNGVLEVTLPSTDAEDDDSAIPIGE